MADFKNIKQVFLSILFSIVLTLPLAVQFFHIFECHGHESVSYNNEETQVYQDEVDCQICNFSLTTSNYSIEKYPDFCNPNIPSKVKEYPSFLFLKIFQQSNKQLRAPPNTLV